MAIIRIQKRENPFVQIDRTALEDSKLSWKAKGILSYLLSKPDHWKVNVSDLEKHATDKERSIYSGIKELRKFGYCKLEKIRDQFGKIVNQEYHVFEQPYVQNSNMDTPNQPHIQNSKLAQNEIEPYRRLLHVENQDVENPDVENPDVENSYYSNNNSSNNELSNNECERENALAQKISEKPETAKNQKSKTIQTLKKETEALSKKVAQKKVFPGEVTFEQSPLNEIENFEILLSEIGCAELDIEHYYTKIRLNALEKGLTKSNWAAYIEKWIYNDKVENKLVWKKSEYSEENQQDELRRNIEKITEDFHAGIFTTKESLSSILNFLRIEWKNGDDFNREQITMLANLIKKELELLAEKPETEPAPNRNTSKNNAKKIKLKDRLKGIKDLENSS